MSTLRSNPRRVLGYILFFHGRQPNFHPTGCRVAARCGMQDGNAMGLFDNPMAHEITKRTEKKTNMVEIESKSSLAISDFMKNVEPGSERYTLLQAARNFKVSWIDLGSKLYRVRQKKLYQQWGYQDFETYCRKEIRIQPQTAQKLTASYHFLKTEDPALLKNDATRRFEPDIQVVDMLRKARTQADIPDDKFKEIKNLAYAEPEPASVRRMLKEQMSPYKTPKPIEKPFKRLLSQASRLADSLEATPGIPQLLINHAKKIVDNLRELK